MPNKNNVLNKGKSEKNDEFYTRLTDIEKELIHYSNYLKGKTVYCNCDDPQQSNFYKYFQMNFNFLGLKRLICTHYVSEGNSYYIDYTEGGGMI